MHPKEALRQEWNVILWFHIKGIRNKVLHDLRLLAIAVKTPRVEATQKCASLTVFFSPQQARADPSLSSFFLYFFMISESAYQANNIILRKLPTRQNAIPRTQTFVLGRTPATALSGQGKKGEPSTTPPTLWASAGFLKPSARPYAPPIREEDWYAGATRNTSIAY